jgi:hypothetical protein
MNSLLWTMGSISMFAAALFVAARRVPVVGQALYLGFKFWTEWLPVVSTVFFAAVVLGNVTGNDDILQLLPLPTGFSKPELLLLCILATSFLTKIGSVSALLALLYLCGKSIGLTAQSSQELLTVAFLFAFAASVVALNDFSPWKKRSAGFASISARLRRIFELGTCLLAMGAITFTIYRLPAFGRWLESVTNQDVSLKLAFILLAFTFIVWLAVSLKIIRNNLGIALILPTVVVLSFICHTSFSLALVFLGAAFSIFLVSDSQPGNITSKF